MKTINISSDARVLNALLNEARRESLILESEDGDRFVLTPIGDWQGFDIGDDDDFAEEVKRTSRNAELMSALTERKRNDGGKRYTLDQIKAELGID